MCDLAEIAAAVGITIVDGGDAPVGCGVNDEARVNETSNNDILSSVTGAGDSCELSEVLQFEIMFKHRYTDSDPEYKITLQNADAASKPPCVEEYSCRKQKDNFRGRNRGGYFKHGDRGREYRGRDYGRNDRDRWERGTADRGRNDRDRWERDNGDRGRNDRDRSPWRSDNDRYNRPREHLGYAHRDYRDQY